MDFFRVVCPEQIAASIRTYLERNGCRVEELVDPVDVFPRRSPATLLRGARTKEDMTQQELSDKTLIPRRHISEMENGKRPIGKQTARKLGEALKVDPRVFLL